VHLSHFKNTLLNYLLTAIRASFGKKLTAQEDNLNPCHQMPFLGSKYAKIAFATAPDLAGGAYNAPSAP